jgi:phosphoribosylformimino-5-aminoimidazole carboxamide ribonucleotide (ProFAR) isomerase
MIVFPAIDLKGGQVVRLAEGDMARATVYGDNPAAQAQIFATAGSQFLHVVDLDGSFAGRAENREAVEAILQSFEGHVQLGGGIRTRRSVEGWFNLGVSRVVMGTAALKDPEFVKDMAKEFPAASSWPLTRAMVSSRRRAGPTCRMWPWSIWPAGLRMRAWPRCCSPTLVAMVC